MKLLNFSSNVHAEIFMIKTDQVIAASGVFFFSEIHNKLLHLHSYFPLILNNKPKHACCGGAPFSVGALSTCLVCLWVNPPLPVEFH